MNARSLAYLAAAAAALCALGVALLDRPLAEHLRASGWEGAAFFAHGTHWLDLATGREVSKLLLGGLLGVAGVGLLRVPRARKFGEAVLMVGVVNLSSTLLTGMAKPVFGRLRPFKILESGAWDREWFQGGDSFPSGHTGFYFGLFLPIALLLPRWRWPLLLVPIFIAIARIDSNEHFLSDVCASIVVAALLTLAGVRCLGRRSGTS